ncbi:MAG: BON domain-containing protein [Phenylobacterium sp.]
MFTDGTIKRLVEDELIWEPSIDATGIGVSVVAGIVTLTGHVPTFGQKATAEQVVKHVKSVRGLVDHLDVRVADSFDDEQLARRIANLLDWDVTLPKGAVKVQVADGFVTLTGEVPWHYQRAGAEFGLRRLAGVVGLRNLITVKPQVRALDVKRRIELALNRQADLDSGKIAVTVDGDTVRLDGKVKAWFERDVIERAAWAAPGVRRVEDHVVVERAP